MKRSSQKSVKIRKYYHSAIMSREGSDYGDGQEIIEEAKDWRLPRRNGWPGLKMLAHITDVFLPSLI